MPIKIDAMIIDTTRKAVIDELMQKIRPQVEEAFSDMVIFGHGLIVFDHVEGIRAARISQVGETQ